MNREQTAQRLRGLGVPEDKAPLKAASWVGGVWMMVAGFVLVMCAGGLLVVPMLVLGKMPDKWLIAFAVTMALGGLWIGFSGAHAASGEASAALEKGGEGFGALVAKALRAWTRKVR